MDKQKNVILEVVYVQEIALQAKIAISASKRLKAITENSKNDPVEIWGAIQSILVATANVSKILWPPRSADEPRGKSLRNTLNLQ